MTTTIPRTTTPALDHRVGWTPRQVGFDLLDSFASELVGIARRTFAQLHDHDDAHLAGVGAQACESSILLGASCNELNGGGSADDAQARAASIGETIERYSVAWADSAQLIGARSADLTTGHVRHITPGQLQLFAPEQFDDPAFPFARFEDSTPLEWIPGRDLSDGETTLVPARLVYMLDYLTASAPIGYATSNGLACACTFEEAVLSGVSELAERDAFMATWYGRLTLPRIDPASDPELARFFAQHVDPAGLDVALIDMSALVDIPSVLAVIRNDRTAAAPVALGAASSPSPFVACSKAVIEAFQTRTWAKAEQREGAIIDPADGFDQVKTFDDHVRMSIHPAMVEATRFLDASTQWRGLGDLPSIETSTPAAVADEMVSRLTEQGVDVIAIDVTSPDVAEGGLRVVKCFAPQLSPLDSGYRNRFLGGARLRRRAFELGLVNRPLSFADLNPHPHPFP